jgi:hypothetical protein
MSRDKNSAVSFAPPPNVRGFSKGVLPCPVLKKVFGAFVNAPSLLRFVAPHVKAARAKDDRWTS